MSDTRAEDTGGTPREEREQTDGGEIQKYDAEHARTVDATQSIAYAADGMEEFNRLLWQLAKSLWIITSALLAVSLLVIAFYAAEFMVTL